MFFNPLSWIPGLGPIIDGLFGWLNKRIDLDSVKYKTDGEVDIAKVQAQTSILLAFKDDPAVRLARDLIMFPTCVWTSLVIWDKIVTIPYPNLVWGVTDFAGTLMYLPYAVLVFLFGNAYLLRK